MSRSHTYNASIKNQEGYFFSSGPSRGAKSHSPTTGSTAQVTSARKRRLHHLWLRKLTGIAHEKKKGLCEAKTHCSHRPAQTYALTSSRALSSSARAAAQKVPETHRKELNGLSLRRG